MRMIVNTVSNDSRCNAALIASLCLKRIKCDQMNGSRAPSKCLPLGCVGFKSVKNQQADSNLRYCFRGTIPRRLRQIGWPAGPSGAAGERGGSAGEASQGLG